MNIITHSPKSHADDLLAVSLLLSEFPKANLIRTTHDKISDFDKTNIKNIFVDIGRSYNGVNTFDHHQDVNLPASMILVIKKFFKQYEYSLYRGLWSYLSTLDTLGPKKAKSMHAVSGEGEHIRDLLFKMTWVTDHIWESEGSIIHSPKEPYTIIGDTIKSNKLVLTIEVLEEIVKLFNIKFPDIVRLYDLKLERMEEEKKQALDELVIKEVGQYNVGYVPPMENISYLDLEEINCDAIIALNARTNKMSIRTDTEVVTADVIAKLFNYEIGFLHANGYLAIIENDLDKVKYNFYNKGESK